ncbi:hypothetical protein PQR66_16665 [Paraburkholderia agricolaris]|uniref:Uncharacterized protein n=1 Tax=Paraburkholderia agricolaris TaxID=2152888 RepID=A0ABW8ZP50_9BURK
MELQLNNPVINQTGMSAPVIAHPMQLVGATTINDEGHGRAWEPIQKCYQPGSFHISRVTEIFDRLPG